MDFDYIEETNNNLNNIVKFENAKNQKYYKNVLKIMKIIFNSDENSLLKIKPKTASISIEILKFYNKIVKKYNLNKPLFDVENYNIEYNFTYDEVNLIVNKICENLFEKINYKLIQFEINNKIHHKIILQKDL